MSKIIWRRESMGYAGSVWVVSVLDLRDAVEGVEKGWRWELHGVRVKHAEFETEGTCETFEAAQQAAETAWEQWLESADLVDRARDFAFEASIISGYQQICEENGCAPSSTELLAAIKRYDAAKAKGEAPHTVQQPLLGYIVDDYNRTLPVTWDMLRNGGDRISFSRALEEPAEMDRLKAVVMQAYPLEDGEAS